MDAAELLGAFERTSAALRPAPKGQLSTRNGLEQKYGPAYQALVKAGLRAQLKRKYRGGV